MKNKFGDAAIEFWNIQRSRLDSIRDRKVIFVNKEMKYQCENCGEIRLMFLESGLEETLPDGHRKPVPFTILCPKCYGLMRHVDWQEDRKLIWTHKYILGFDIGSDLFVDISGSDCGVPIYSETLDGLIPSVGDIHARSESNRAQRRAKGKHPMWEETRYKRTEY